MLNVLSLRLLTGRAISDDDRRNSEYGAEPRDQRMCAALSFAAQTHCRHGSVSVILLGTELDSVVPSPNWPKLLFPQQ